MKMIKNLIIAAAILGLASCGGNKSTQPLPYNPPPPEPTADELKELIRESCAVETDVDWHQRLCTCILTDNVDCPSPAIPYYSQ
jgi:hypothetical protein